MTQQFHSWADTQRKPYQKDTWLIRVNVWQKPLQYCKVISLQLIKLNGKKKTHAPETSLQQFTIARIWKQPKYPSAEEWTKKVWHRYVIEYYSAIERN